MSEQLLVKRSNQLIDNARFVTLATQGADGPWASTVNYIPLRGPLRLLWYSMRDAQHSYNIEQNGHISGSIFMTGLSGVGIDGAQFTGKSEIVAPEKLHQTHAVYYEMNFPDPEVRQQWLLPIEDFQGAGPRRFFQLTIERWWLLDIDQWLVDKTDQRISVAVSDIDARS